MSDMIIDEAGSCPECGHCPIHIRDCDNIHCEDGSVDDFEDDPIWFSPGDTSVCPECKGTGRIAWCPSCEADITGQVIWDEDDDWYDDFEE